MPAADLRKLERYMFFAITVAAHVLVLSYLARDRIFAPMAEPPAVVVSIVRLPPPPLRRLEADETQAAPTRLHRTPLPVRPHKKKEEDEPTVEVPTPEAEPAPVQAPLAANGDTTPGLRTDLKPAPAPPPGIRWRLRTDEERMADCQAAWTKQGYPGVAPCGRAEPLAANAYRIERDGKTAKFTGEARYNEAIRAYNEAPGDAGFPGMRCTLLKKC